MDDDAPFLFPRGTVLVPPEALDAVSESPVSSKSREMLTVRCALEGECLGAWEGPPRLPFAGLRDEGMGLPCDDFLDDRDPPLDD